MRLPPAGHIVRSDCRRSCRNPQSHRRGAHTQGGLFDVSANVYGAIFVRGAEGCWFYIPCPQLRAWDLSGLAFQAMLKLMRLPSAGYHAYSDCRRVYHGEPRAIGGRRRGCVECLLENRSHFQAKILLRKFARKWYLNSAF
jgi:hypothetical protein